MREPYGIPGAISKNILDSIISKTNDPKISSLKYNNFRIKHDTQPEVSIDIQVTKIGNMVTISFPTFSIKTSGTTGKLLSYFTTVESLIPSDTYNTNINANGKNGYAIFQKDANMNWFVQFSLFSDNWEFGATTLQKINAFSITYVSSNTTELSGTSWGSEYSPVSSS